MKTAMLAKAVGVDPRRMQWREFEGTGAVMKSLIAGQIAFYAGNVSVISQHLPAGNVRLLAILAEHRLPGSFANVPTAKELGYNATWTLWRGLYMGPDVSEAEYNWWVDTLGKLIYTPEFVKKRESQRLYPFTLIGKDFDAYVKKNAQAFRDFFKTLY